MEIIEVRPFARRVRDLFDDDQYHEFQRHLVLHPETGMVIPGVAYERYAGRDQVAANGVVSE